MHSKFKRYDENLVKKYEDEDVNIPPEVRKIKEFGYIKLTSFDGTDETEIVKFGESLHNSIQDLYNQNIKGWIVDLRDNPGGNMDPMILGLGPLIERNPTAYFLFPEDTKHSWGYLKGTYYYNGEEEFVIKNPAKLDTKKPTAILINEKTASSAEMLVVSLLNKNVKVFGRKSKGRTTGNAVYKLEDKSKLVLSTCKLTDLKGKDFLNGIEPDIFVDDNDAMEKSMDWINQVA